MKKALVIASLLGAVFTAPAQAVIPVFGPGTLGQPVIVSNTGSVEASFEGGDAALISTLFLGATPIFTNDGSPNLPVNLGNFTAGDELIFTLHVLDNGNIFSTGPASRNADTVLHAGVLTQGGKTYVGFEDTFGGGDQDYNDLVFSFTNTRAGVPEPATWGMLLAGFGLVGGAMRRRSKGLASITA